MEMMRQESDNLFSSKEIIAFAVISALMLFSMYSPYIHSVAIVFQILAILISFTLCKNNSLGICIILILNVTREYISVSTSNRFEAYYSLNATVLLLMLVGLSVIRLYESEWRITIPSSSVILFIWGLQLCLSQVWVENQSEYTSYFPVICLLYLSCFTIIDKKAKPNVMFSYMLSGLFMGIGIIPYYLGHGTLADLTVLINGNGLLVDRNYQSLFLMMCILNSVAFLKCYWFRIGIGVKILASLTIIGDLFIIIVGASRSAVIGLLISVIAYMIVNGHAISKNIKIILITILLISAAYNIGLLEPILDRFMESDVASGNGRFDLWVQYLAEYENGNFVQKLFGRGLIGESIVGQPAHNLFVSIFFSFGIVGIISFLLFCILIIVDAFRFDRDELIVLIPLLFMCCTLEPYYRIEFALYISCLPTILYNARAERNSYGRI